MVAVCGCAHNQTHEKELSEKPEVASPQIERWVPIGTSQIDALRIMGQHHFTCYLTNDDALYFYYGPPNSDFTPHVYHTWYFIFYLKDQTVSAFAREESEFPVYSRVSGYGFTNTWYVPTSKLMKLPGWNGPGEPPLSVGKAVSVAKAWIASKSLNNSYVNSIDFKSFNFQAPSGPCWIYIIHFQEVAMFGSWATCVVLPDGSVVEPETTPQTTNIVRYLD